MELEGGAGCQPSGRVSETVGAGGAWKELQWWRQRVGQVRQRRRVLLLGSVPLLGQGRELREPYCGGNQGGGGGSVTSWGVSGCSWARIGAKVTSKEGRSSSQKRPWRKARTLASKASPAMSRGAPTRRPPKGFLEEEGLKGGLGGGVLVEIMSDAGGVV